MILKCLLSVFNLKDFFTGLVLFMSCPINCVNQIVPNQRNVDGFRCPNNCGRSYKYSRNLKTHLKYECGVDKTFRCIDCGKKFAHKAQWKKHALNIHKKIV